MAIAFKEWQVICEALGNGAQDVLIRKGGIHEGKGGFEFIHDEFYLFPTLFHKQYEGVIAEAHQWMPELDKTIWEIGELVPIRYRCKVTQTRLIRDWDQVLELSDRHVYSESLLRERFDWEGKGMESGCINVASVIVEKLEQSLMIPYEKSHGGCRSWVEIACEA